MDHEGLNHERGRHVGAGKGGASQIAFKDKVIGAAVYIFFILGIGIIFAPGLLSAGRSLMDLVGDPILFVLSLAAFLVTIWNIAFYLEKRKELLVAKKIIRMVATQGKVIPRLELERLDRLLLEAIWSLRKGDAVASIVDRLQVGTHGGEAMWKGARSLYDEAIVCLTDAAGRDQVLGCEQWDQDLLEGEKMLWAARVENLRCLLWDSGSSKTTFPPHRRTST